mmetsp:Transcript_17247/g.40007  ORF Transcript_17247/g.40007 Transcript_17247/m.40007 type:complete len:295 (+) Transcript_17247:518-1402(+)
MKIGLHSKSVTHDLLSFIAHLFHALRKYKAILFVSRPLHAVLQSSAMQLPILHPLVQDKDFKNLDLMLSMGGDGTLLETVRYVKASETPVLGINLGRMGFLATVMKEDAQDALASFWKGQYTIDKRTLLQLEHAEVPKVDPDFALNEVAFLRQDSSSMMEIHASINGQLHTSYWADGLIIATPTGSTGYSLSCGGPIVLPSAHNLVITPVSPHNLSVRPLVVPDNATLSFEIRSRNKKFLLSLDGRSYAVHTEIAPTVKKAPFQTHLVKVNQNHIFDVLRKKLHWGLDVRNDTY